MEDNPHERARLAETAKHMTTHDPTNPTWRYRMKGGKVESKVFPAAEIPEGWEDSPAKCMKPEEPTEVSEDQDVEKPRKPGRPRKVRDGDST